MCQHMYIVYYKFRPTNSAGAVLHTSACQKWYNRLWTKPVHSGRVAEEFDTFPQKVEASKLKSDELI